MAEIDWSLAGGQPERKANDSGGMGSAGCLWPEAVPGDESVVN